MCIEGEDTKSLVSLHLIKVTRDKCISSCALILLYNCLQLGPQSSCQLLHDILPAYHQQII